MSNSEDKPVHMTPEEFRSAGYAAIDWLVDYLKEIEERPVTSEVVPGEVRSSLPEHAPETGEPFQNLLDDMDRIIAPGITQWQHPGFYGYFPANSSPPAVLGDLLSTGLGVNGMLWATSPAATELETHVLDWLVDLCGLPKRFHSSGAGGGVIQDSASSATLCAILAARHRINRPEEIMKLRAYVSNQAHSSAEKGLLVAGIHHQNIRLIEPDENLSMCLENLEKAISEDIEAGYIPFFVMTTVGTTSSGAVDNVEEIAKLATKVGAWVHVDAAWAGSATICPEFRGILNGLDLADSYAFNPHKWMLTNFDCSAFFVADAKPLTEALSIVPEYLRNSASEAGEVIDYRDWQVPLGRRFRALKLWFVLRSYGAENIRTYIRRHVQAANWFAEQITDHPKLELSVTPSLSLVCFQHVDGDTASEQLLTALNATQKVLLTHTRLNNKYVLRVAVGGTYTTLEHVEALMQLINEHLEN